MPDSLSPSQILNSPIHTILATDCGSTTTKAILIELQPNGEYRLVTRGEAPTTVEAPFDDVTVGVTNAVREVEELSGRTILGEDGKPITPAMDAKTGVDLYLSTSSAGGGLQMTVTGLVKAMSAESAQRAALGAGAIVIDTFAVNDGRKEFERVERLRQLRPDMILMAGGEDDSDTVKHLVETAEMLVAADPKPRLGVGTNLPVIYAGNRAAFAPISELLGEKVALKQVANVRPKMDLENLGPAREAIHELFLEHVMQQAPGYAKLTTWTSAGIMSTPNAVGKIMTTIAAQREINVLGVDIGGATTDVFSVFGGVFNRTVSANLGMSYSICNVLTEAGVGNIKRWLPFPIEDAELRNRLRNKMIRPTTIPQRKEDLQIEQAVCREALRLAFEHHKSLARGLTGVTQEKSIGNIFGQEGSGQTLVNLIALDMIVGSGGVLSHAPRREQSALMMLDAYEPQGFTLLTVDSIFMMPQLGILSTIHPEAATQVFERDCLIYLGTCIAPIGVSKEGEPCLTVEFHGKIEKIPFGALKVYPLGFKNGTDGEPEAAEIQATPAPKFDLGAGKGVKITRRVQGGVVGVIIDTRGRPFRLPTEEVLRIHKINEWQKKIGV